MPTEIRRQKDEHRKMKTREKLFRAAVTVFGQTGYHAANVSDIVRKAGVGQGTFYRHFADKREIFEMLMERLIDTAFDEFSDMSANLPEDREEYRQMSLDAIMRMAVKLDSHRELLLLFLREAPAVDKEIEETVGMIYDRFAALAQHYLDHAIEHGFARPCRSDVVAQSIVGIGLRIMELWWSRSFDNITVEEMIREAIDFAFMGLTPPCGADNAELGGKGN